MGKQSNTERPLPQWVRILAVFVPLLAILLTYYLNRDLPVSQADCPEKIFVTGTAYSEDGTTPLANTPIQVFNTTVGQSATASDGSFTLGPFKDPCNQERIRLGVKPSPPNRWITRTVILDTKSGEREIDLGSIIFPATSPKTSKPAKPGSSISPPKSKEQPVETGQAIQTYQVKIIYPNTAYHPKVAINPSPIAIKPGIISCQAEVLPGQYEVHLSDGDKNWAASFSHRQEIISANQFHSITE